MIYFGNDIVDTRQSEATHPRWVKKVLSESEQNNLPAAQSTADRSRTLLRYWAAKEAAFKAFGRHNQDLGFYPKQFEYNPASQTVTFKEQSLHCRIEQCNDYIYAFVFDRPRGFHNWIEGADELIELSTLSNSIELKAKPDQNLGQNENQPAWSGDGLESTRVRELAAARISNVLSIPEEHIEIRKRSRKEGHTGVPELYISGRASEHLISFSHHGRYVACALAVVGS